MISSRCLSIPACLLRPTYDSGDSTTAQHNGSEIDAQLGFGTLKGVVSGDVVTIGDLGIQNQLFGEATTVTNTKPHGLLFSHYDGVLGLAYDRIAVNQIPPPFYNIVAHQLVNQPLFAFYFADNDKSAVTFGFTNSDHYTGQIMVFPVRRKAYWEVELEKITLGDDELELENTGAAFDTGSSLITFPADIADMINTQIGGRKQPDGRYRITCDKRKDLPHLTFYFGGTPFSLSALDYVPNTSSGLCVSAIVGLDINLVSLSCGSGSGQS